MDLTVADWLLAQGDIDGMLVFQASEPSGRVRVARRGRRRGVQEALDVTERHSQRGKLRGHGELT